MGWMHRWSLVLCHFSRYNLIQFYAIYYVCVPVTKGSTNPYHISQHIAISISVANSIIIYYHIICIYVMFIIALLFQQSAMLVIKYAMCHVPCPGSNDVHLVFWSIINDMKLVQKDYPVCEFKQINLHMWSCFCCQADDAIDKWQFCQIAKLLYTNIR